MKASTVADDLKQLQLPAAGTGGSRRRHGDPAAAPPTYQILIFGPISHRPSWQTGYRNVVAPPGVGSKPLTPRRFNRAGRDRGLGVMENQPTQPKARGEGRSRRRRCLSTG